MQRILYIIFSVSILLTSCKKETVAEYWPETTPQTTLMYMTGTDLLNKGFYTTNISAAKQAIAKNALGYGRFLVFKHISSTTGSLTEYSYSNGSCTEVVLKEYSDITSLTQEAIIEVIADTKEFAPADSYNLIISGHGTGWVPQERQSTSWSVAPAAGVSQQSTSYESVDWEAMSTSLVPTRYMGSSTDSFMDIDQLESALASSDTHFGYIIFDQCFMSSIEVLYDLRNHCNYMVASPCEIMGAGFPYDTVVPYLYADSGYSFNLEGVCQAYYDYYSTYSYPSGCVAVAVSSQLDALAAVTREINSLESPNSVDLSTIQPYERLSNHIFYDFEQYMLAKCSDYELAAEFTKQMALAFPLECRLHTERFFANIGVSASSYNNYDAYYTNIDYYSGVTTSAPSSQMSTEWAETSWAAAVGL
ncbi:MAG: clostripain-related cysteine peptidase [Rikenellaceae bacterium]